MNDDQNQPPTPPPEPEPSPAPEEPDVTLTISLPITDEKMEHIEAIRAADEVLASAENSIAAHRDRLARVLMRYEERARDPRA